MKRVEAIIKRRILAITGFIMVMQGITLSAPQRALAANSDSLTVTIQLADQFPPKPVTDLTAGSALQEWKLNLSWTAPSEDTFDEPSPTPVASYDVRYATFSVLSANANTASWWNHPETKEATNEPFAPQMPGVPEFMELEGLRPGVTYYFAITSKDEVPNESDIDTLTQTIDPTQQAHAVVLDLPPDAPTNLVATPGVSKVDLSWNAVINPDLDAYNIYVDSTPDINGDYGDSFTFIHRTASLSYTDTGLVNGTSYYYIVRAVDDAPFGSYALESVDSNVAFAIPFSAAPPNAPTLTVDLPGLTTSQIRWVLRDNAFDETGLYVSVATYTANRISPNLGPLGGIGNVTPYTETGLVPNTLYTRYGEAYNALGSSWSASASIYTLANPPANTHVVAVTSATILLAWSTNGNADPTLYEVEYDKDSSFVDRKQAGSTTSDTFTIFGLDPNVNYWVRVRARNGNLIYTNYDVAVSTKTTKPKDTVPPKAPHPIKVNWDETPSTSQAPGGHTLRIEWRDVTKNMDGTLFDDPAPEQYRIYRSKNYRLDATNPAEKVWNLAASSARTPGAQSTVAGTISGTLDVLSTTDFFYYRVHAVDMWGNESPDSLIVEAKGDGSVLNVLAEGTDKISQLSMPADVAKTLMRENNAYGDDLLIKVVPVPAEEKARVVRSVQFEFFKVETGQKLDGFILPESGQIKVGFMIQNGYVIQGAPSEGSSLAPSGAPIIEERKAKDALSLFWHNGVEWVKVGGTVDQSQQRVALNTRRLGRYQIRQAIHIGPVALTKVYPRIISPNDDGWNDKVIFEFDNPAMVGLSGEIFDVTGAKVADMVPGPSPDTTLMWDGKRSGTVVPAGVYIYQIDAGGETATGTIVVAQ